VKAFTLEHIMRERFDQNVAAVEHELIRWRAYPIAPASDGDAWRLCHCHRHHVWRLPVIETGATPGQFFSFIAAFLLAYEPAKRLARLNIELNSALVGVASYLK
jgi:ATP-binding cassette subfamily B protein